MADAKRGRGAAESRAREVTAGTAPLENGMSQKRALEILNGCIGDYNTMIKRLDGRYRG
jgi:hypothetical protein